MPVQKHSLLTPEEFEKLLYTLDQLLPPHLSQYDISMVCSYIVHRYGLPFTAARDVYALCLDFMLSSQPHQLDLSPPSSDREIN